MGFFSLPFNFDFDFFFLHFFFKISTWILCAVVFASLTSFFTFARWLKFEAFNFPQCVSKSNCKIGFHVPVNIKCKSRVYSFVKIVSEVLN